MGWHERLDTATTKSAVLEGALSEKEEDEYDEEHWRHGADEGDDHMHMKEKTTEKEKEWEGEGGETYRDDYDDEPSDGGWSARGGSESSIEREETRSRFTEYSISSSVLPRSKGLSLYLYEHEYVFVCVCLYEY